MRPTVVVVRKIWRTERLRLVIVASEPDSRSNQVSVELEHEDPDSAAVLLLFARKKYWGGDYESCYTLSRHAADIFRRYGRGDEYLDALTETLSASRPQRWGQRLQESILEAEQLCSRQLIDRRRRWQFLDRLALVLFDYARIRKSAEVIEVAARLLEKLVSDPWNPGQLRFDVANSHRRAAVIRGAARRYKPGEDVQRIISDVLEYSMDFDRAGEMNSLVTGLDVASKLYGEVAGDQDEAHAVSERALQESHRVDHYWALQEHLVREAEYFFSKRDEPRALDALAVAVRLYEKAPVVLEPIVDETGPRHHDLQSVITRWNVRSERLAERGAMVRPALQTIPLPLTDGVIDRVVLALMQGDQ